MTRLLPALILALATTPASAARPAPPEAPPVAYAPLAGLALTAPVATAVDVRKASLLKGELAQGVPAGKARYLIEGDVRALIRGAGGLPAQVTWLADLPLDARGKPPKLPKGTALLLLAATVPGRSGELRLVGPEAMLPRSPANEQRLRAILAEAVKPDAPPRITGVTGAFHVPGSLPGESETQIFLRTADARPISLTVLRRPGENPRWAVALGELTDASAEPPARETLLWYQLACGLPAALPEAATAALGEAERAAAQADYAVVLAGLGACG